jgi:hypothetical protein
MTLDQQQFAVSSIIQLLLITMFYHLYISQIRPNEAKYFVSSFKKNLFSNYEFEIEVIQSNKYQNESFHHLSIFCGQKYRVDLQTP